MTYMSNYLKLYVNGSLVSLVSEYNYFFLGLLCSTFAE